jgi:hypothetical protein
VLFRRLAALALLALACAAPASARARGLTTGFSADPVLTTDDAATRAVWIPRAVSEGAGIVRLNVLWSQVAPATPPPGFDPSDPASPGYNWSSVDAAVTDLTSHGLQVLITIESAPTWAEAPDRPSYAPPGSWEPNAAQFGEFASAAATRYDGHFDGLPRVRYWEAWNEPNLDLYLSPQWTKVGRGWQATSPTVYRGLLNSFYTAVKRASGSNFVVGAATAPYGDPAGADPPGDERMAPVAFYRYLLCINDNKRLTPYRCPDPAHLDAVDHHPYGIEGPLWHALNRDDAAVPDIYKIANVVHAAQRAGNVLPRGPKALWVTEIGWDSRPPNPKGVPAEKQARWYEQSLYVLWRQGVDTVLFLQIVDSPPIPNYFLAYEEGVYYVNGQAKPAATAFRFPFVTRRLDRRHIQAWGRAPQSGVLKIEMRRHGHWAVLAHLRVSTHEVFSSTLGARGRSVFRAQLDGQTSLTWSQAG